MYKLNCTVLGDDPRLVFEIKTAPTESVSALRKVIKDVMKPQFEHVAADGLTLWQVDLPVNKTIEQNLTSFTLDTKKCLLPVAEMLDNAQRKHVHVHIIIRPTPTVSSGPLHLKLNYILSGDNLRRVFEIKIAPTESVSALQKLIKDAQKPQFDCVAADAFELWQVKVNLNDLHLLDAIKDQGVELKPLTKLFEVFTDGVERGCVHVVVLHPTVGENPIVAQRIAYLRRDTRLQNYPTYI
ncbi:uncharacterized protein HD556DRAFT_772595 [Suillus plorans]|uniref:Crinkler effector protein N-terminal domain-containing protein n=1 Tax=Suillus plorans TaxID=116603 RepID=A0A9P7AHJ8_9AGAM|nr:uncharacterized protein HD556DRAFT_772595 [Suillus plorans]KAG1789653.1 hypothetical protein HD556DRAFT_772595 [Suillus plorans]